MTYLKCSLIHFFCRNISFKLAVLSDRFASQLVSHLHSRRIATRVHVSSHHARIFSDDMVNIHHSLPHALHLLSSKITSPSMVKRRARGICIGK